MRLRLTTSLLAASLLANAIFIAATLHRRSSSEAATTVAAGPIDPKHDSAATSPAASSGESITPDAAATLGRILNSRDPALLRDLLQAAGVERELLHQLVAGAVWKSYENRFKTLNPDDNADDWWKGGGAYSSPSEQRKRSQRSRELRREIEAKIGSLLGPDYDVPNLENSPWLQQRYGSLPPDKVSALLRIEKDYQEISGELQQTISEFELPADREALRLLKAERERDIAALLTPEESAALELRTSNTANRLRWRMAQLDATEAEYLKIYPLQKAFDEQFERDHDSDEEYAVDPETDRARWERRRAAQDELNRQIRAIIGEDRYLAAQKQHDQDYTVASLATSRLGLADDTPDRLYALRTPAIADSQKIAADPSLTADQKKAALKQIAATTRSQVEQTLGAEAAAVYFKRGAMEWLKRLEDGAPLKLSSEGRVESGPRIK